MCKIVPLPRLGLKTPLKSMYNKRLKFLKKDEYVKFKNYETKIKSPFIILADFESILVPENDGNQNPKKSFTKKY